MRQRTLATAKQISLAVGSSVLTISPDRIELVAGGATVTLAGGVVTIDGDAIIGGISFKGHVHPGVMPGPMLTAPPQGGGA